MAQHFTLDLTKSLDVDLYGAIQSTRTAMWGMQGHRDAMVQLLAGADQSVEASYAPIAAYYSLASNAVAKSLFAELDACVGNASPSIYQLAAEVK